MERSTSSPASLIAHSAPEEGGEPQSLEEHLSQVAKKAAGFAEAFDSAAFARWLGWWHDAGKVHKDFQDYIKAPDKQPRDRFNAVLSFLYTLLLHDCSAAAEGVGLDYQLGFLHAARPGRPSLGLDLMEELRAYVADRLALTLINRQQLTPSDFRERDGGAVLLNEDGRKEVVTAYQKRKKKEITHPFLDRSLQIGLLPHVQARLLARTLRGDMDAYIPFLAR